MRLDRFATIIVISHLLSASCNNPRSQRKIYLRFVTHKLITSYIYVRLLRSSSTEKRKERDTHRKLEHRIISRIVN